MRVLAINCFEEPKVIEIENTLKSLQMFVCGDIEYVNLSETAGLICNEEGKLRRMRANRFHESDLIFGDFLIVGINEDDFCSLSESDIEKYTKVFKLPETYEMLMNNGQFMSVRIKDAGKSYVMYDLIQANSDAKFKFLGYNHAVKLGLSPKVYKKVYRDIIPTEDVNVMCEKLYMNHNTSISDRKSHSMSISDIIVFHFEDGDRYFYTDLFGFQELNDFKFMFDEKPSIASDK